MRANLHQVDFELKGIQRWLLGYVLYDYERCFESEWAGVFIWHRIATVGMRTLLRVALGWVFYASGVFESRQDEMGLSSSCRCDRGTCIFALDIGV